MAEVRQFTHDDIPRAAQREQAYQQAKRRSREAAKQRKLTSQRWKWEWVDSLTDELRTAQIKGDTRRVFAIHKELGIRDDRDKLQMTTKTVLNPEAEREAWKEHFRTIQEGKEWAEEHVWENIKVEPMVYQWLTNTPSHEEIHKCGQKMSNNKAAGIDGFLAEFYKYGSETLQKQVSGLIQQMWQEALRGQFGEEGAKWPESWHTGIVIPLWKRKGSKTDKSTWRGITLLSVGSKLLARVVASRVQAWTEQFIHEAQAGFRQGRGVDDVLQVTRRIVEEVASTQGSDETLLIRLFDIEKAYPRVSRDTLWKLMIIKGAPREFVHICKALHEDTKYQVRIHQGLSNIYQADKGLREGCPSSPPLFNLYHHAVLEDYRIRRAQQAELHGYPPGIPWTVKIDGRCDHSAHSREHVETRGMDTVLGDIGFADDTCIMGIAEEVADAEILLETTMRDWKEKVHPGKTEGLRLQVTPRSPYDVRYKGEQAVVRHVGGMLHEKGQQQADTSARRSKGYHKIRQTAVAWNWGKRNSSTSYPYSLRIKVMKAVLMPTLTCFGRSRSWNKAQIRHMQQVINWAVMRCLLIRKQWMHTNHVKATQLNELVQWEPFETTITRQSLLWLGHLARMKKIRLPKQAFFGFWAGHKTRTRPPFRQGQWIKTALAQIQVSE